MTGPRTVLALGTMAALLFIDANYMVLFAQSDILHLATWFELLVFGMQFVKTGLALGLREFRDGGAAILVDLYGVEILLMPVLLLSVFVVGPAPVGSLLNELLRGWMVGVAFTGLPYAAYRLGRSMLRSGALPNVLPPSVLAAEFGVLFVNASASAAKSQTGLVGVADFALLGKGTITSGSPAIFAALTAAYVCLLLYAVLGLESKLVLSRNRALTMAALATGATLAWVFAFSPFSLPGVLILFPPSVAVAGISWWFGHGR